MASILDAFPIKLCLTMPSRLDRRKEAEDEFRKQKIQVDFWDALPGDTPFQSFNRNQFAMIEYALKADVFASNYYPMPGEIAETMKASHVLFFEDDVVFKNTTRLPYVFEQLPEEWDVLYLGANITNGKPEKYSQDLCKVTTAWTTHAVAYSRKAMHYIHNNFDPLANHMFDDWLSRELLPKCNAFVVSPMMCWQRPGRSDLWNTESDYTDCFIKGDKIMQAL